MRSGEERDAIAAAKGVLAFEMESAGVWDVFPCVVIKGGCDYADNHKNKKWQRYAAATAAACMKALLKTWMPSTTMGNSTTPTAACKQQCMILLKFCLNDTKSSKQLDIIPYTRNPDFIGREDILKQLQHGLQATDDASQFRMALFGLGGVGYD